MLNKAIIGLTILTLAVFCNGDQWLMEGDFVPDSEALKRQLHVVRTNSSTSVSSSLNLTLKVPANHIINCVIAASLHMNGKVALIEGGLGIDNVTLAYDSLNNRPDVFFVLVEFHAEMPIRIEDNVAKGARVTILYDRMADWRNEKDAIKERMDDRVMKRNEE